MIAASVGEKVFCWPLGNDARKGIAEGHRAPRHLTGVSRLIYQTGTRGLNQGPEPCGVRLETGPLGGEPNHEVAFLFSEPGRVGSFEVGVEVLG